MAEWAEGKPSYAGDPGTAPVADPYFISTSSYATLKKMAFWKVILGAALLAPNLPLAMATSQTPIADHGGPSLAMRAARRLEHDISSSFFA